jgi:hypothetical protein
MPASAAADDVSTNEARLRVKGVEIRKPPQGGIMTCSGRFVGGAGSGRAGRSSDVSQAEKFAAPTTTAIPLLRPARAFAQTRGQSHTRNLGSVSAEP